MPKRFLVLVLIPLGAVLAFLSLEVIGIPLVLAALALVVHAGRRSADLPLLLMGFGIGFAGSVGFFALRTSAIFTGDAGAVGAAWFAAHFAFGLGVVAVGSWLLQRRTSATEN
jgi:hypothetical protein